MGILSNEEECSKSEAKQRYIPGRSVGVLGEEEQSKEVIEITHREFTIKEMP